MKILLTFFMVFLALESNGQTFESTYRIDKQYVFSSSKGVLEKKLDQLITEKSNLDVYKYSKSSYIQITYDDPWRIQCATKLIELNNECTALELILISSNLPRTIDSLKYLYHFESFFIKELK